jgi:type II secretory ATPase GspE/PulE/Tfp pilus assembly ATPase PilB-like protein
MARNVSQSSRGSERDEPDEWLIDAARRARHELPRGERPRGTSAWRVLLNAGIAESEVLRLACDAAGTEPADFKRLSPALSSLLPHGIALKHRVAPLGVHNGTLGVATSNPNSPELERELAFAAKQRVRLHAASPSDILSAQAVVYGTAYGTTQDFEPFKAPAPPPPPRPAPVARLSLGVTMPPEPPVVAASPVPGVPLVAEPAGEPDVAERLLAAACVDRASEASLDPTPDGGLLVRVRVDGVWTDRARIAAVQAKRVAKALLQRAGIDPAKAAQGARGRTTFKTAGGVVVEIRVSVESIGDARERIILRLFSGAGLLGVSELGYSSSEQHLLTQLLGSASGLVVVAGPADAGTTTTLYAVSRELQKSGRAVSIVEEPIEFPLEQVAQVQVSESSDSTLASAVRAALDGNANVVIAGIPLDAPTIAQCVTPEGRARLMIASLDTADMPSTLARLRKLQPDRALLAGLLEGIVAQRLVRRLCPACAAPQSVSELPELQQRLLYGLPMAKLRRPVGCAECRTTGYMGRTAIAEVVPMVPAMREAIAGGATPDELAHVAREHGMRTLWDSGMSRVLEGVTSLAELLDTVAPPTEVGGAAPQEDIDALLAQLLGSPHMHPVAAVAPTLPIETPAPEAPAEPTAPVLPVMTMAAADASTVPTSTPSAPVRVLLVDDDGVARRALAKQLTQAGFEVLQAADGTAAVTFAKRLRPDIILTEVALPRLDAVGLLGALASENAPFTVVVHTAQADEALHLWLREAGARAILPRDMPTAQLVERLRELILSSRA